MNGILEWVIFLMLSGIAVFTAAGMILTMSMYRAGLALMASFVALAGLFVLLDADLLAAIQIMMNVGGMLVMVLFMVMMMMDPGGEMMWAMKRDMHMKGPGAFSMHMPWGKPPEEQPSKKQEEQGSAQATAWTCPMHPEVRQDHPGTCPQCGMALIPTEGQQHAQQQKNEAPVYTCPMHPEVRQDHPGSCPKCGMSLVLLQEEQSSQQENQATLYTCPMHPEVRQDQPGNCPKCGMTLVPMEEEQAQEGETTIYTCPMHPEVRQDHPGTCPKCGMTLIPAQDATQSDESSTSQGMSMEHPGGSDHAKHMEHSSDGSSQVAHTMSMDQSDAHEGSHARHMSGHDMHMAGHEMNMAGMTPRQYYQMMVDMAMSTAQLPWAIVLGIASALLLILLIVQTPWQLSPVGPTQDATTMVGELLLSRYMIGFEGAAFLILAGIAGAVILAKRERAPVPKVQQAKQTESGQTHQQVYTCPMHPEVRENQPGSCPKCGMNLLPTEETASASSQSTHGGSA
jgi:NADH:ubiquinone oxidoreductase subunit 6 (subunit J)